MGCDLYPNKQLETIADIYDAKRIPVKKSDRKPGPYPYYGASGIVDYVDSYIFDGEYLLLAEDGENLRTQNLPIAFMAEGRFWVNNHAHILKGKGENSTRFLCYALQVADVRSYLSGSTRPKLTQKDMRRILLHVPEPSEQRAIAHILGSLDDKIELNRQMNRTLEKMAQAIFKSWFIDFDPVRAKVEGRDPGLPKEIADLFPDSFEDSELGEIPKGWEVGVLGDIAKNPRRGVKPDTVPPVTPYIGLQDMPKRCIALDKWGRADEVGSQKSQFSKGEILFGKLRPYFHKVGIAPVDGVCSTDILVVVPKAKHWSSYTLFLVSNKTFIDYTDSHSAGTRMPRTNWKDMSQFSLVRPPLGLLEIFEGITAPYIKQIIENIFESRSLSSLRDTLLPKMISGELPIPDAEKLLEGVE